MIAMGYLKEKMMRKKINYNDLRDKLCQDHNVSLLMLYKNHLKEHLIVSYLEDQGFNVILIGNIKKQYNALTKVDKKNKSNDIVKWFKNYLLKQRVARRLANEFEAVAFPNERIDNRGGSRSKTQCLNAVKEPTYKKGSEFGTYPFPVVWDSKNRPRLSFKETKLYHAVFNGVIQYFKMTKVEYETILATVRHKHPQMKDFPDNWDKELHDEGEGGDKDIADEMADVLWVLICLANQTGVDLTKALEKNFEKKNNRDATRHINNEKLK
jgi:hypothetical protein